MTRRISGMVTEAEAAPSWLHARPFAHRGRHGEGIPENSMAAFERALRLGDPIELDVHVLVDDTVAVFHDGDLSRMTGRRGPIADLDAGSLSRLRLGDTDERIPSFDEVLALVIGRVPLLVDLKRLGDSARLEREVISRLAGYEGPVAVQAFDPRSLVVFRELAPGVPRGILSSDFSSADLPAYQKAMLRRLILAPWVRPHYVAYDLRCLPYWAPSMLRRLGCPLLTWTVRSLDERARARRLADNYIFEHIDPY